MFITLNDDQKKALEDIGFKGFTEDTDNILFYVHRVLCDLEHHNKNYTKDQYYKISTLQDIFAALCQGF